MKGESFFHLCAYEVNQAISANLAQVNAINDSILTILNNSFVVPQPADLVFAAGFGVSMSALQINTPSFRYVGLPQIGPLNAALTVPSPVNIYNLTDQPLKIPRVDTLELDSSSSNGAAQEHHYGFLGLSWGKRVIPPGVIFRLKATASITAVSAAWANGTMTMSTNLPQGQYAIVGMTAQGTNLLAARLIIPGASYRPGVIAMNAINGIPHPIFTRGDLGVYGTFENVNLPNLEICADGACTAQQVWLDLVRIGDVGSTF